MPAFPRGSPVLQVITLSPVATQILSCFTVHVGPFRFEVRITSKPIVDDDGEPGLACADEAAGIIWISASVHPSKRWAELEHEVYHLHEWIFAKPRTPEERAKMHTAVSCQVRRDVMRQGGESALMGLVVA